MPWHRVGGYPVSFLVSMAPVLVALPFSLPWPRRGLALALVLGGDGVYPDRQRKQTKGGGMETLAIL